MDHTPATFRVLSAAQFVVEPGQTGTISIEGPRTLFGNWGLVGFHVFNADSASQSMPVHAPP